MWYSLYLIMSQASTSKLGLQNSPLDDGKENVTQAGNHGKRHQDSNSNHAHKDSLSQLSHSLELQGRPVHTMELSIRLPSSHLSTDTEIYLQGFQLTVNDPQSKKLSIQLPFGGNGNRTLATLEEDGSLKILMPVRRVKDWCLVKEWLGAFCWNFTTPHKSSALMRHASASAKHIVSQNFMVAENVLHLMDFWSICNGYQWAYNWSYMQFDVSRGVLAVKHSNSGCDHCTGTCTRIFCAFWYLCIGLMLASRLKYNDV